MGDNEKLNICFFIGTFRLGGAENLILQIISNLDRTKYNIFVAAFRNEGSLKEKYEKLGVSIHLFPKKPQLILKSLTRYAIFLRKNKIHVLHTNLVATFLFSLSIAKLMQVKNIIVHWHNVYDYKNFNLKRSGRTYSKLRRWFLLTFSGKIANSIIAISNIVKESNCNRFGIDKRKVYTIYNAVDLSRIPQKEHESQNIIEKKIGCIGKVTPQKGYETLIKAMKTVVDKYPELKLEIVGLFNSKGNEDYCKKLLNTIENLELTKSISFLGEIPNEKIYEHLNSWSLFALASWWEGFGIVIIEAMAAGTPVIASNVDAIPEIINDGENGLLFESKNPEDLANKIITLIENKKMSNRFKIQARKDVIERFSIIHMIERLDKIYDPSGKR